jgi:hypothetical protein
MPMEKRKKRNWQLRGGMAKKRLEKEEQRET